MCDTKTLSLSFMESIFSHLRVAVSAQKGKISTMAGIYKLEEWTVEQRGFRKVIQGFNFLMKNLWGMFCLKLKSMSHLALGSHFIVSSQGLSACPWLVLQRRGRRMWQPPGKCRTFCHPSAPCSGKTWQSTSRTPLLWCCCQTGIAC